MVTLLNVPYFSQRDNLNEPTRSCNISACAMAIESIKPGVVNGSDDFYAELLVEHGDTTNHDAHTRLLTALGFKTEFRYDLTYKDLNESLYEREMPVVIGVLHRGYYKTPSGGHMIVVIGRDSDDNYICHDPWGQPFSYSIKNGENVKISAYSLNHRWLVDGDNSGWGRLFY